MSVPTWRSGSSEPPANGSASAASAAATPAIQHLKRLGLMQSFENCGMKSIRMAEHLLDQYPCRVHERKCDKADRRGCRDEQGIIYLPSKERAEGGKSDEHGDPVSNGHFAEQQTSPEDRPDRRSVGTLHKALHIGIGAVAHQEGCRSEDQNEGRKEDSDRRGERPGEPCNEIADKGRRDDHRTRTDHAHRNCDQEVPLSEPPVL